MIIEIVGTPGAGKSTVARGLAARSGGAVTLRYDSLRSDDDGRWIDRVAAAASHPALASLLVRQARGSSLRRDLAAVGRLLRRDRLAQRLPAGTVLDSGVLFGLAAANRRLPVDVAAAASLLHLPTAVVDLRVDAEVALARIEGRGGQHRTATLSTAEAIAYLQVYRDTLDRVLEAAAVPTVTVDTTDRPADEVVATSAAALETLLAGTDSER